VHSVLACISINFINVYIYVRIRTDCTVFMMKIHIKETKIVAIESTSNIYYLREEKPLKESEQFLKIIQQFETFFDTSLIETEELEAEGNEWESIQELRDFLQTKTEKTLVYFEILSQKNDWISTQDILTEMGKRGYKDLVSQSLSGIRSGNTKSYRKWDREPLDERKWNNEEWQNYYRIDPKYQDFVKEATKEK